MTEFSNTYNPEETDDLDQEFDVVGEAERILRREAFLRETEQARGFDLTDEDLVLDIGLEMPDFITRRSSLGVYVSKLMSRMRSQ